MQIKKLLVEKLKDIHNRAPVNIAFLGDSVTQGCFETFTNEERLLDGNTDYEAVYHNRLRKKIQAAIPVPVNMINAGNGGGTTPQALERIERDIFSANPALTVVCLGLNDAVGGPDNIGAYGDTLVKIFRKLKTRPMEVIMMTPNRMNDYVSPLLPAGSKLARIAADTAQVQSSGLMDRDMQAAREAAASEGVQLVDAYARWCKLHDAGVDTTALLANHVNHPVREMHQLFADALYETMFFQED